jgi:hypothetical protein
MVTLYWAACLWRPHNRCPNVGQAQQAGCLLRSTALAVRSAPLCGTCLHQIVQTLVPSCCGGLGYVALYLKTLRTSRLIGTSINVGPL